MFNIFYWVKKRLVWGVFDRRNREKGNETSLKEGRGIEMSTTVLPFAITNNYNLV